MPTSARHRLGKLRAGFTAEPAPASLAGIGRDKRLGLDDCTSAQRRFRALLALHLFNTGGGAPPFGSATASAFLTYSTAMSPRHDLLAVINGGAVDNIAGRLLPNEHGDYGVAGLRLTARRTSNLYHLIHVPTGARMVLTDRPVFAPAEAVADRPGAREHRWPGPPVPLSAMEQHALYVAGSLSPSMEALLAGLAVRVSAEDPARKWSLTYWSVRRSQLDGFGDRWEMWWERDPHPRNVAAALTDPVAGVAGAQATVHEGGRRIDVTLGSARLRLSHTR